jgi:hypothetical protein
MTLDDYERLLSPARERFAISPGVRAIKSSRDGAFLESFLLHFSALGSRMTAPVERWIRCAAERCAETGLSALARALRGHARAEANHHLMMIADVRSLATRWNSRRGPTVDADMLLNQEPTPGVLRYCEVHEQNITGTTAYAQIAIEYEVEMLPLRYGELFISHCLDVLGPEILPCLSFVTEHIISDVGHTDFNARAIGKLLDAMPGCLSALVSAGTAILDAYAQFLTDCAQLAARDSQSSQPLTYAHTLPLGIAPDRLETVSGRTLTWRMHPPLFENHDRGDWVLPEWVDDVRTLRGSVFFADGRRPHFRTDGRFSDSDPIDLYANHVLAYDGSTLVGCIRVYRLTANGPASVTETILGEDSFLEMLRRQGVQRSDTVEIGRWVVDPAYRTNGRAATQLAAAAAMLATTLGNGTVARQGMVVCAVGTGDQQDLLLSHIGLTAAPVNQPIRNNNFNDDVRVMQSIGTKQLHPRFRSVMKEMAQLMGLVSYSETVDSAL